MRLQLHLFMAAFVLSTAMIPCLALAAHSPEISEQDLAPYKELGSSSIAGVLSEEWRDYNHNYFKSTPGNVKVSLIPVTPYTKSYFTGYRHMLFYQEPDFRGHSLFGGNFQGRLPFAYLDQHVYSLVRSTISQADGSFHVNNLAPGSYFFIAEWCIATVWGGYIDLVVVAPEEPITVTKNQTINNISVVKAIYRDCVTLHCYEFVQDQWFPTENSLVNHQEELENDR